MAVQVPTQQHAPSPAAAYWQATRSYSFPASIVPVLLGGALAWRGYGGEQGFNGLIFALTLLGAVLAQAGGNVYNDYFDFVKGVDTRPEHGSGVLTSGLLTKTQMFRFGFALLAIAGLCGVFILLLAPARIATIAPLALLGLACAVLYTIFLKQRALGDLVIMTAFGVGLTAGAYGVLAPFAHPTQIGLIMLLSVPVTLLVDAILHANNIRDARDDSAAGVRTVASLLGEKGSQIFQAILVFGPVALVNLFVVLHLLPISCLATLLALPLLIKAFKTGDVPFTAQSHLVFGALYALSVAALPRP